VTIPQFVADRFDIVAPPASRVEGTRLLAFDTALDRRVAVTVFQARLLHELTEWAQSVGELDAEGLLVPEQLGLLDDGRPYLVEPWPDAGTLARPASPLTLAQEASVLADAVATLARLHGQGIAHAAFEADNIAIGSHGGEPVGFLSVPGLAVVGTGARVTLLDDLRAAHVLARPRLEAAGRRLDSEANLDDVELALRHASSFATAASEADAPALSGSVERMLRAVLRLTERDFTDAGGADAAADAVARLVLDVASGEASLLCQVQGDSLLTWAATGDELGPGAWMDAVGVVLEDLIPRMALVDVARTGERRWAMIAPLAAVDPPTALVVASSPGQEAYSVDELDRLSMFAVTAGLVLDGIDRDRELERRQGPFQAVLDGTRDGVVVVGSMGVVEALNRPAAGLLGTTPEEAIGLGLRDIKGAGPIRRALTREVEPDGEMVEVPGGRAMLRLVPFSDGTAILLERVGNRRGQHRSSSAMRYGFDDMIGSSDALAAVLRDARLAAGSDVPVLITGESGTGKEMMAQAIHGASDRAAGPFIAINVAAIPSELLESELFGYERGAFTGARASGMPGKFELANGGTLLLDEIGDMPYLLQAKLLRVLQERQVQRLGSTREVPVDVRIVATTHRFLEEAVKEGRFRLDLFYRLRVVHLKLPALRERPGDLRALLDHHLANACVRMGRAPLRVSEHVIEELSRYPWPGNVRELANVTEAWASLTPPGTEWLDALPSGFGAQVTDEPVMVAASKQPFHGPEAVRPLADVERDAIFAALDAYDGNVSQAARALGVSRGTLYNKLSRYREGDAA